MVMVIFSITPRSAKDLALTRTNSPFSKETLSTLKKQESQFTFEVSEAQRLKELKKQTMQNEKRQKMLFEKYETVQEKSTIINLDFADRISKVIPYSLIPVIAIGAGYFLLKGRK